MSGYTLDRRTGGLEMNNVEIKVYALLDRRTGGLENVESRPDHPEHLDRRTGGLENPRAAWRDGSRTLTAAQAA